MAVMGFKCNGPILPTGITVISSEEVIVPFSPPMVFPVPNAPDRGELVGLAEEPNTGNRGSFITTRKRSQTAIGVYVSVRQRPLPVLRDVYKGMFRQ